MTTITATQQLNGVLVNAMRVFITASVPLLLVMFSVRLLMFPVFLQLEYNRPGFPEDPFGFTTEDRLNYAPYALRYLTNREGIDYLGDLTFEDDSPLYNQRELRHMEDVKVVTVWALRIAFIDALLTAGAVAYLWRNTHYNLKRALFDGALLTLGIIVTIVFVALTSWDIFFTGFHQVFFEGDSWLFLTSDTLIRLFPEQLWFDAALVIGSLTVLGAGLILALTWRWHPTP